MLYFIAGEEASELLVNELSSVVSYHGVRYLEAGEDVSPDELSYLGCCHGG